MDSQRELTNAIIHTLPNGSILLQCEYGHAAGPQEFLLLSDVQGRGTFLGWTVCNLKLD